MFGIFRDGRLEPSKGLASLLPHRHEHEGLEGEPAPGVDDRAIAPDRAAALQLAQPAVAG